MRTIIDITEEQVKALDELSELEKTSRAALIRRAIDRMLAEDARKGVEAQAAFGLWSHTKKDGLEIEALLRRGKTKPSTAPKAEPKPAPAPQAKPPVAQPPVAPVIEDTFVTPPPEPVPEAPKAATPPAPPPPPPPAAPQAVADPLAAFFAGVKP